MVENKIELTKIYRQREEAPLLYILQDLRSAPFFGKFKDFTSPYGSLYNCKDAKEFLLKAAVEYKLALANRDPYQTKIITYTNSRIEAYNNAIHKILYKSADDYCTGEFVMGYDNFGYSSIGGIYTKNIYNSLDYLVKGVRRYTKPASQIFPYPLDGYLLDLHNFIYDDVDDIDTSYIDNINESSSIDIDKYLFILDRNINKEILDIYIRSLEETRLQAIQVSKKSNPMQYRQLWKRYYELNEYAASPIDLYYDTRLVKSATLKLGYAISTHKS